MFLKGELGPRIKPFRVQVFQNNKISLIFLILVISSNKAGSKLPARPSKRVPKKPPCLEICNLESFKVTPAPLLLPNLSS